MKSPDESKKGLECCANSGACVTCPYDKRDFPRCVARKSRDALALIQQYEADKQQLEGLLTHMNQLRDAAAGRALKMEDRVHQLEAERDAAVAELKNNRICQKCKHFNIGWNEPCLHCDGENNCFEWRGVQKEG